MNPYIITRSSVLNNLDEIISKISADMTKDLFGETVTFSNSFKTKLIIIDKIELKVQNYVLKARVVADKKYELDHCSFDPTNQSIIDKYQIFINEVNKYLKDQKPNHLDYHVEHLRLDKLFTRNKLEKVFKMEEEGINIQNDGSIVLISEITENETGYAYRDTFDKNGNYIYLGWESEGNQSLNIKPNVYLRDAMKDKTTIYLFVKFSDQEYYYQGEYNVMNIISDYETNEDNDPRKIYKFELRDIESINN
ncbi:MAG: hypothetical protein K5765_05855 [Clostridia bacterium]|nr:hypothetical protein [Clostridia bacterium]